MTAIAGNRLPLAVDLDGTLVLSDTLHEGLIGVARARPRALVSLGGALRHGKAAFKSHVALLAPVSAQALPYNEALLAWLRTERRQGRRIGLFTAADQSVADAVASEVGLFDVVRGSDAVTNLSGPAKAEAIAESFGPSFAYAGDAAVDQPIFARATSVVLAGPVEKLRAGLPPGTVVEASFPAARVTWRSWADALRLRHWVKNVLVFAPAVLGLAAPADLAQAGVLFVLMGLLASSTYVVNDLFDLGADRAHPLKRHRPFAAGLIPLRDGVFVAAILGCAALAGAALLLPPACALALLAYLGLTLAYSVSLKRLPMIDVAVLAGLFTLRILAGSLVTTTPVSPWLLSFSMMFFLGLAMIKRYAEVHRVVSATPEGGARGYTAVDLPLLLTAGIGAGLSAVVILMVHMIAEQYPRQIYAHPWALWGIMPLVLTWVLHMWRLAANGRMSEDPVLFAVRDRTSLVIAAVLVGVLAIARW